jgi:hypothetical protein
MPAIDIDRDAAHDAAQRELAKPIYPKASLTDRIIDWLNEQFVRFTARAADVPGGWFTIAILILIVVIAAIVAIRIARHTMRTNRTEDYSLFGENELSAAEHRATAQQYAVQGDWSAAIRHRLRAVARQLEEDGVVNPVPGRTASELARNAGQTVPGLASELLRAANTFNDVTYGQRPGTELGYRTIADLDDHLRQSIRTATRDRPAVAPTDIWAEVR